ncbi:MAG: hypothetical protein ACXWK8_11330 [Myxococcaceae bacterium]
MRHVRRLLLVLLLGAPPVWAHSVTNELALGLNDSTPSSPRSANVADQLTFRFDLNDDWTLKVGAAYTVDPASAPAEGAAFGTSSTQIFSAVGGVDWDVSSRVNLYLDVSGSPVAGQTFDSLFGTSTIPTTEVLLYNATSSVGALAGASITLGGTEFLGTVLGGTVLDLSLGWTLLTTRQRVDAVVDGQGRPVSRQALTTLCRAIPSTRFCKGLQPYLAGGEETHDPIVATVALLHSVGPTTDLGLWGSVAFYDKDPITALPFSARVSTNGFGSLDSGFPLAPLRWAISPSFQQQLGSFSIFPWYEYLVYASDLGQAHVVGLRVSLRIGQAWTVWLSGSVQWNAIQNAVVDPPVDSNVTSGRVALGFRARF